jgi:hypothetical protein
MRKIFYFFIFVLLLSGCHKDLKGKTTLDDQKSGVSYCVGRLNFELPKPWIQHSSVLAIFEPRGVGDDGDVIEVLTNENWNKVLFQNSINSRIAEIKTHERSKTDILELKEVIGPEEIIIRIRRIGFSYKSELHKLINGTYLRISTDSYNGQYGSAENRLKNFSRSILVFDRSQNTGFCIGNVVATGDFVKESVDVYFENPEHPDALLSFDINTYREDEEKSLIERVSGKDSLLNLFKIHAKVIRKGEIKAAGMTVQEWMAWMPSDDENSSKYLHFAMESRRDKPTQERPSIHIEFKTGMSGKDGDKMENSYGESDAVVLWDNFVKSISIK